MKKVIKNFLPAVEAIQRLLYPYAEVIVHDVKQNIIVAIYNPFSKRRAGDASRLDQDDLQLLNDCVDPYEKTNWNGNKIKSVSSMIRDENHNVVGMLCINLDVSVIEKFNESLQQFLQCAQLIAKKGKTSLNRSPVYDWCFFWEKCCAIYCSNSQCVTSHYL